MYELKIGDVVCLVGDIGPRMVVDYVPDKDSSIRNQINCIWFDTHDIFHEKLFKRSLLTLWVPPGKPEPTKPSSQVNTGIPF
jgi:uncharacterized protein YodC (DUF2158 family)